MLRDLAAIDGRFASRAHLEPSEADLRRVAMAALLDDDSTVAIVGGRIDPFSFAARERGLAAARRTVERLPPDPREPSEAVLLRAVVDAELTRLDEEKRLPRSASALVRALVADMHPPANEGEAAALDRWLVRRLAMVRESIAATATASDLDVVRARELDDALDALEPVMPAASYPAATKELVRLREAVEAAGSRPEAKARSDWELVSRRVRAYLGEPASAEELARELDAVERELRRTAERAQAEAPTERHALLASLERVLFPAAPCVDAIFDSRVRSMAAPPEREASCHLRHLVAEAKDGPPQTRALALAAMHDHVVVAEWALDVARGASTLGNAEDKHHRLLAVPPPMRSRLERIALARPVAAIGAGLTAKILTDGDPFARAAAWSELGDVPLDVAAQKLAQGGQRVVASWRRPFLEMSASFSSTSMSAIR